MPTCNIAASAERKITRNEMPQLPPVCEETLCPAITVELRHLHRARRIACVDDFTTALLDLRRQLMPYFREEDENQIDAFSDPAAAQQAIIQASRGPRPYDLLVTDLFMQRFEGGQETGFNGDELLKNLAKAGLLLPTVVRSGSWANDLKSPLLEHLDSVRFHKDLERVRRETNKDLGGLPIIFRSKQAGFQDTQQLIRALQAVLLTGERFDRESYRQFLLGFSPKVIETSFDRAMLARMAELGQLMRGRLQQFCLEARSSFGPFTATNTFRQLETIANDAEYWDRTSFNRLTDPNRDRARSAIHLFEGVFQNIPIYLQCADRWLERQLTGELTAALRRDGFAQFADRWANETANLFAQYMAYNAAYKNPEPTAVTVGRILHGARHACGFMPGISSLEVVESDQPYYVNSRLGLLEEVVAQPLMNAVKAVRDRAGGQVRLRFEAREAGSLPKAQRSFFEAAGLASGAPVAAFIIEDNGPGIPEENLPHIFTEGFSTFGTSGWGLSFYRSNLSRLGGTFEISTEVGAGTVFTTYVPICAEPPLMEKVMY